MRRRGIAKTEETNSHEAPLSRIQRFTNSFWMHPSRAGLRRILRLRIRHLLPLPWFAMNCRLHWKRLSPASSPVLRHLLPSQGRRP